MLKLYKKKEIINRHFIIKKTEEYTKIICIKNTFIIFCKLISI